MKDSKKLFSDFKKTVIIFLIGYILIEAYLWYLETNEGFVEPYEWGNRNDIPYKISECSKLFAEKENRDKIKIIIIGDSGPESGFNPELLDTLFDKKTISYNLGFYATGVRVQSLIVNEIIIPKLKPDIVIWDLSVPNDFEDSKKVNNQENTTLNHFGARYYSGNTDGLDFEQKCDFYFFKFSRLYRYRQTLMPNIFGLNEKVVGLNELYGRLYDRGWLKHKGSLIIDNNQTTKEEVCNVELNKESRDLFFETIKNLEKKTEYFFIINKPFYKIKIVCPTIYSFYNKLSPKNFLDLNGKEELYFPEIWMNVGHLNEYGANYYTHYIYEKISQNYQIE